MFKSLTVSIPQTALILKVKKCLSFKEFKTVVCEIVCTFVYFAVLFYIKESQQREEKPTATVTEVFKYNYRLQRHEC